MNEPVDSVKVNSDHRVSRISKKESESDENMKELCPVAALPTAHRHKGVCTLNPYPVCEHLHDATSKQKLMNCTATCGQKTKDVETDHQIKTPIPSTTAGTVRDIVAICS